MWHRTLAELPLSTAGSGSRWILGVAGTAPAPRISVTSCALSLYGTSLGLFSLSKALSCARHAHAHMFPSLDFRVVPVFPLAPGMMPRGWMDHTGPATKHPN